MTYSFLNGTAADASSVNTNFTDLIQGTSDGTKDFNISALTAAGVATLNGNVILGSASGDDLTINASLAASIPIKTTRTYDIGSADLGLRILYLGMNSTHTIALQAPSSGASADYSLTLPPTTGTIYDVPYSSDAASTLLWKKDSALATNASGGTSGVTLTTSSTSVSVFTPSAAITIKLDNSFTAGRQITIVNNGTAEISLTANDNTVIATVYRQTSYKCVCPSASPAANTDWLGLTPIISPWISATSPTGSWTTNMTHTAKYKRNGSVMDVIHMVQVTGAIGTPGNLTLTIPESKSVETGDLLSTSANRHILGDGTLDGNGARLFQCIVAYSSTTVVGIYNPDDTANGLDRGVLAHNTGPFSFASNDKIIVRYQVPISGWSATKG